MLVNHYVRVHLADIVQINPPKPAYFNTILGGEVAYINLAAVSGADGLIAPQWLPLQSIGSNRRYFKTGDLLLPRIASGLHRQKIAQVIIEQEVGICSPEFSVIRPDLSRVAPRYLFHWLRQQSCGELKRLVQGTARKRVTSNDVASAVILLPPIAAQEICIELMDTALKTRKVSVLQMQNAEKMQLVAWQQWLRKFRPAD
jgi:restriction endonuclease S subunit